MKKLTAWDAFYAALITITLGTLATSACAEFDPSTDWSPTVASLADFDQQGLPGNWEENAELCFTWLEQVPDQAMPILYSRLQGRVLQHINRSQYCEAADLVYDYAFNLVYQDAPGAPAGVGPEWFNNSVDVNVRRYR